MYVKNRFFVLAISQITHPSYKHIPLFRNRLKTDELNKHQNEKKNYRQWLLKISFVLAISQITQPPINNFSFI